MSKPPHISSALDSLMKSLLKEATGETSKLKLDEKLKILDRGLKLEAIKAKLHDDKFGTDFDNPSGGGQDEDV